MIVAVSSVAPANADCCHSFHTYILISQFPLPLQASVKTFYSKVFWICSTAPHNML